ncbi:cupin domain-containing protein [Nioella nitratireducens]|uniref:cupin domain-containing protein n=1 Tax=Nioella nitratireducens TaxID=1287720 RepID=UPI0008FD2FF5|nr:cupin domain-containing protein [Nioella nitratireducens]
MPKIDLSKLAPRTGSIYPAPYDAQVAGRSSLRVGDAGGLTQFGANIVILAPGAKSSLRHWHVEQDEFVMVTQGTCTLVDDLGETPMAVGDCATFKAGDANGHCFVNNTDDEARFLVIGTRTETETAYYSDLDLKISVDTTGFTFTRKDGSPLKGDDT